MYLAAVAPPRVPGARPSSASSARNSRCARRAFASRARVTRVAAEGDGDCAVRVAAVSAATRNSEIERMAVLWRETESPPGLWLQPEPLEERLGQRANDAHDGAPEPWNVGDLP